VQRHVAGRAVVISSPSGGGKTTLIRRLQRRFPSMTRSVSVTTRRPRRGERQGREYLFVSPARFRQLRRAGELLEWARVHDAYYGTPQPPVEEALGAGRDMLFDIDWQGTQQLKEKGRTDLVTVFILPPSTRDLERRLISRAQDAPDVVARRMAKAADEMSHWAEYDYAIINRDIATSLIQLKSILTAERLKRDRQFGLSEFVKALREGR